MWRELNCLNVYNKDKKITAVCTADITVKKSSGTKNASFFFIGFQSGLICYANEHSCDELGRHTSGVISIMFYQQNQSIVIITESLEIRFARLSGTPGAEKKVKLSLSSEAKYLKMCWVAPCSFAITSWDNIVRMWNLKEDSNYSLNLSDINREAGAGMGNFMGSPEIQP